MEEQHYPVMGIPTSGAQAGRPAMGIPILSSPRADGDSAPPHYIYGNPSGTSGNRSAAALPPDSDDEEQARQATGIDDARASVSRQDSMEDKPEGLDTEELPNPLEPPSRVTATLIPVLPPPEPPPELQMQQLTPGQEMLRLLSQGRGNAMIIATPPPNSGLPTLVAQQLPNGTVVVQEIPVHVPFQCSAGWILFALGFVLPPCWLIGTFLPFCTENHNDRRASVANSLAFVIFVFVAIGLAATTR